jgi:hypothetical protein
MVLLDEKASTIVFSGATREPVDGRIMAVEYLQGIDTSRVSSSYVAVHVKAFSIWATKRWLALQPV